MLKYTGWVKKKAAHGAKLYIVISNIFIDFYFFVTQMAKIKIPEPFFSQNQMFRKAKMCLDYFYQILKFDKDWITENLQTNSPFANYYLNK